MYNSLLYNYTMKFTQFMIRVVQFCYTNKAMPSRRVDCGEMFLKAWL